jgi:iron complex transport system substrate-binding protein
MWAGVVGIALAAVLLGAAPAEGAQPAQRVVSLNPSLTAIALALGAREQLVGVDDYSSRSPGVAGLPTVGGLYDPSLEAVIALAPDLVVLVPSAEQRGFRERLEQLGVACLSLDPVSFDDVLGAIEELGARLGREPAASARVAAIRRTRAEVEAAAGALPVLRGVLVLQRDPLFAAGAGTFVDDMLRTLRVENLAAAQPGRWPRLAREWLLAARPELILDSAPGPEPAAGYWARWPSLPAVANGAVAEIPQGVATLPGPDLDEALLVLAAAARGPEFAAALRAKAR